jgi:hypothetical protein
MKNEQKNPRRLLAVRRADLTEMVKWECSNLLAPRGPCKPEDVESGDCCRACWASAFAEKALRGASTRLPKEGELSTLDVWDLLQVFGATVRQLGGGFHYNYETGHAYLKAPQFTGPLNIPVHVVEELPDGV